MRLPIVIAAACLVGACRPSLDAVSARAQSEPVPPPPTQAPFRSEQEWIVWDMAGYVVELGRALGMAPPGAPSSVATVATEPAPRFEIRASGRSAVTMTASTHLWDPAGARQLVEAFAPALLIETSEPRSGEDDDRLLRSLTTATSHSLLGEDRRLSEALRQRPRDPALHERAALLLAVFALRDGAGAFTDIRAALSRMSVHLAVAGETAPTSAGRVARGLLLALVGREQDARAAAAALAAAQATSAERAWSHVIALRASKDWRLLETPAVATPVERLEHARAVYWRLGSQRMLSWVSSTDDEVGPEWARMGLLGPFSVSTGHRFAPSAESLEIDEAQRALAETGGAIGAERDLVRAVVAAPASQAAFRVLPWPRWQDAAARHLAGRLMSTTAHLRNLGLDKDVPDALHDFDARFGALPTAPLAIALAATDDGVTPAMLTAASAAVAARPESVPPGVWHLLAARARKIGVGWPEYTGWFRPTVPHGTAMELTDRALRRGARPEATGADIERFVALAPSDYWAAYSAMRLRTAGTPTMTSVRDHLGALMAFDVGPLQFVYDYVPGTDEDYLQVAKELCALDKDRCDRAAGQHLVQGREDEAVAALDAWFDTASDRVAASGGIRWAVHYHFDQGRRDRALQLARRAGATGSALGLEVQAEMLERSGHLDEAEALYLKVSRRYGDWNALPGAYYLRRWRATGDEAVKLRALKLLEDRFPAGLELASKPMLPPVPTDGVRFRTFGARLERAGLHRGDIVVGIDGYRVRSMGQYWVLMRQSWSPTVEFVVFRNGRYADVIATVPQRFLGAMMGDLVGAR